MPRKKSRTEQFMELLNYSTDEELTMLFEVADYEMRRRGLLVKRKRSSKVAVMPAEGAKAQA